MQDLISRQAAIDALIRKMKPHDNGDGTMTIYVMSERLVKETLNDLPVAQPERKKGKWIYNSPVTMKCNQCGFVIKDWDWHRFKYCPNCIADMRGEQDG